MWLQILLIYFWILFSVFVEGSGRDAVIEFDVFLTSDDNMFGCQQDNFRYNTYNILEGQRAHIKFNFWDIDFVRCTVKNGIVLFDYEITWKSNPISFLIEKVHAGMSGQWKCTVRGIKNKSNVRNRKEFMGNYYATTACYAEIHVKPLLNPMHIIINDQDIHTIYDIRSVRNEPMYFHTEYLYTEGEYISVFCSQSNDSKFEVSLEYKRHAVYRSKCTDFKEIRGVPDYAKNGCEINVTMQANDDKTYIMCWLHMNEDQIEVYSYIKFVLKTDAGTTATQLPDVTRTTKYFKKNSTIIISSTNTSTASSTVSNKTKNDENLMHITINDKNISTKRSNQDGNVTYYYNEYFYTEGEHIDVFCSRPNKIVYEVSLVYKDHAELVYGPIFKDIENVGKVNSELGYGFNVTLQSNDDGTQFMCSLHIIKENRKFVTNIKFILNTTDAATTPRPFPVEITTLRITESIEKISTNAPRASTVSDQNNSFWIGVFIAIGLLTVIVVVAVVTVIYKMKKNAMKQMLNDIMYQNLTNQSDSIPPFPEQWNTNSSATNLSPLYATPVPKSQRHKHQEVNNKNRPGTSTYSEPNYCEVINYSTLQALPCDTSEGQYNNIFDGTQYINFNTEYVDPAYCNGVVKTNVK